MIIHNYLAYVECFAYLGYINVFSEDSVMKRRYQGLKAIRRSKLPKTEAQEVRAKVDTED
jgi:hypothetical protein